MKQISLKVIFMVMIAMLCICTSCKNDPVMDRERVTNYLWTGSDYEPIQRDSTIFPLNEWYSLTKDNRLDEADALVMDWRQVLTRNVSHYLYPERPDSISFSRVKGKVFGVESGDDNTHDGKVDWQILVNIYTQGQVHRKFLICGNGFTGSRFSEDELITNSLPLRFTIKEGEGLANHIPDLQAWGNVANEIGIPIKRADGRIVNQDIYLNYLGKYTSYVFPGDVVDLSLCKIFNKAGQEVDFERRLQEAEKLAKEKAKAKTKKRR